MTRLGISSVFGDPLNRKTWSGAPYNVALELSKLGFAVDGIQSSLSRWEKVGIVAYNMLDGFGRPPNSEYILRSPMSRHLLAKRTEMQAVKLGLGRILHTTTFDLSDKRMPDMKHYLYCDHTWNLSHLYHPDLKHYTDEAMTAFYQAECVALAGLTHIFTFGEYVRQNLIDHYDVPAHRVTAVGSGMGEIEPFHGLKDYSSPHLLFVAKHLWKEKGGELLLEAFDLVRKERPDVHLTIVGGPKEPLYKEGIKVWDKLPWSTLQGIYREATLLVQPMLNDPWGQVYLEALASRTPVIGLNRNGLPEITENGKHGFLLSKAVPRALANAIIDALSDPQRLEMMGKSGQQHVLANYSWDRVAETMADALQEGS
jgi:glycosyltransferase involved in cell wall biosynthesis